MTSSYIDVAVEKLTPAKTGYTLGIKNIGGFAVPVEVLVEYTDGTKDTIHQTAGIWEKNQRNTSINILTKKKIAFLKLDGGLYMDADDKNNTWGTKKEKVAGSANLDKYTGVYASQQIPVKITFTNEDNQLMAEATGQEKFPLTNTEKDTFVFEVAGLKIIFDTAKNEMTLKQGVSTFTFLKEK